VRVLKDQFLVSLPIPLTILVLRLALGTELAETANLALFALISFNLIAALILRSGRVYLSGAVLTFALWAAVTLISWTHPGIREGMVVYLLLAAVIAFLVLPWRSSLTLAVLTMSSIVMLELRGFGQTYVGSQPDRILALVGGLLAICNFIFVVRESLHRAIRQTLSTQHALSKSEKELSSILQRTPDIIYRLDTEGRITFVNAAVRHYGYDPSKMVGTYLLNYVHPDDRELAKHRLNERRTGDRSTEALEIRLLTSRGDERVAEYTAVPVQQEPVLLVQAEGLYESGTGPEHYIGTQGVARDITDRKRAVDALKKSEEKYFKVFHAAPAGITLTSLDEARFLDVNEEFERIYGFSRDELIGRTAFDIGLWPDPGEREHIVNLLRKGEPVKELEVQGRRKNGEVRTVRYNGQLIDIGGIDYLISAVVDTTDQKRLESQLQQAQKLEAVGRLAGGIAHDFNNMLAVILGQAELASRTLVPGNPAHESIHEIQKAAERSAELTRQLLVFARRQDAAPRPLDLKQAISERLAMLRRLIGENVALEWNPAPSPWSVKMDPTQVDQILINLAVNARDAITDVGTLTISTENRLQEEAQPQHDGGGEGPREWVILTVTDTGTGMGKESLSHLFEPFFTTKEIGKGTGMGLATVYGIVQHSSGRIEVESELGKGTRFRVYLPRTLETAMNVNEAGQTELARGNETVLVVEDEPAILNLIRMTLQRLGYSVIEAASTKDALALATQHYGPLHLLLTDVVCPR
jgi:PAS domain S-box-containing protein